MPGDLSSAAPRMRVGLAAFFLILAALFLIANRAAYQGFFQGDELDNLSWTPYVSAATYLKVLCSPLYNAGNFRPVGHFYFRLMSTTFGLDFPMYLVWLHLLHLLNVWLLWMLLRRLGVSRFAAGTGAAFFAFQIAVLDVYWKPMYAFDLFCAMFSLVCLFFWIQRRWVLAFVAFWLAYKSKELAVMLPAVLACYEFWLGKRQWKPLAPFFLVALSFGVQGIFSHAGGSEAYSLHFRLPAMAATAGFYAGSLFRIKMAGFGVLALPLVSRDRRVWLGIAVTVLFLVPLLPLTQRLFSAYWYMPLIGLALSVGALADSPYRLIIAVFVAACLPWTYAYLRRYRRDKLASDKLIRTYVMKLQAAAPSLQETPIYFYDRLPPGLHPWGVEGTLRHLLAPMDPQVYALDSPAATPFLSRPRLAILYWQEPSQLWIVRRSPEIPDASYLIMGDPHSQLWQLGEGWHEREASLRWMAPYASARIYRPAQATQFEVTCVVTPTLIQAMGHRNFQVWLNGAELGSVTFSTPGVRTLHWPLASGPPGPAQVEFEAKPGFRTPGDARTFGIGIQGFGFR